MSLSDDLDHIIHDIKALLPGSLPGSDAERKLRSLLQSQLSKLGVVSREQFEAQAEVLRRSREKIDQLERQLADIQQQLGG